MFWDAPGRPTLSIAAGSLDAPTGLRSIRHIYLRDRGDYYDLPEDGLPRYDTSPLAGSDAPD
jgi:hypothetical protein